MQAERTAVFGQRGCMESDADGTFGSEHRIVEVTGTGSGSTVHVGNDKLGNSALRGTFDLVVTPDTRFVRYLLRANRRNRQALVLIGLLLVITSVGTLAGDGLWFLAGLWGLPVGVMCCLGAIIDGPRRALRRDPAIMAAQRFVFTADAIEWHTIHTSLRLSWSAIRHVSRSPEAYRLDRVDTKQPAYLCRTTLTPAQDERVASYLEARLAERLAAAKPVEPLPPTVQPRAASTESGQ